MKYVVCNNVLCTGRPLEPIKNENEGYRKLNWGNRQLTPRKTGRGNLLIAETRIPAELQAAVLLV